MSSFEILNQALITYSSVVRDNLTVKADSIDIISIITNTSNELKDMINRKADITELANVISGGNSNSFVGILEDLTGSLRTSVNDRLPISVYEFDNIQSNIRFNNIEATKATIDNTRLTGITNVETIKSFGDIYTNGTVIASNLRILGNTSIVNTLTTMTDQLSIVNVGTDTALVVTQKGSANMAEFHNSVELVTVIDNYGRVGINTTPRYELDIIGTSYCTNILGDVSKSTVGDVSLRNIFSSNLNLINQNKFNISTLSSYVKSNFEVIESNINIITNTINYGKVQLLNMAGLSTQYPNIAERINSLEARILYLEQHYT